MTVDTVHVLVDANTNRESLYVAATRGRHGAHVYVADEDLIDIDAERPPAPTLGSRDILTDALKRESGERSATEVRRAANAEAELRQRQRASEGFLQHTLLHDCHVGTLTRALGETMTKEILNDPAFPVLSQTLAVLQETGRDPIEVLQQAATRYELQTAQSLAKVLNHRLRLLNGVLNEEIIKPRANASVPHPTTGDAQELNRRSGARL